MKKYDVFLDASALVAYFNAKEEYLPISAIARKFIAKEVTEELIIEYHRKGSADKL